MCELKENRNKTTVIPRIKMMELLKEALVNIEGTQGLSVAEILKYVISSQEITPKQILPRLLNTIKVAEDKGLIEKLKNDKYALTEAPAYLCGTCGGTKRRRSTKNNCKKRKGRGRKMRMRKRSRCGSRKKRSRPMRSSRKRGGKCKRTKRRSSRRGKSKRRKSCKRKRSSRKRRSKKCRSSSRRRRGSRGKGKRSSRRRGRSRKKCTKSCIVRCEANQRQEELQNSEKPAATPLQPRS